MLLDLDPVVKCNKMTVTHLENSLKDVLEIEDNAHVEFWEAIRVIIQAAIREKTEKREKEER